jgi:ribulose-phosphate 3-epimerase
MASRSIQPSMKNILSASIHMADFGHLADQIHQCEENGVDWIHIDVMDGHFVPNITMGPFIVETCKKITSLPLDVHLMIEKPELHLKSFAEAGANLITVQSEACLHLHRTLQQICELGCKAGVALNPSTLETVLEYALPLVDLILVMTVNPGFSGQSYLPEMREKVKRTSSLIQSSGKSIYLQVDGGINTRTLPEVLSAGANSFVASTAIFKQADGISSAVHALRALLD